MRKKSFVSVSLWLFLLVQGTRIPGFTQSQGESTTVGRQERSFTSFAYVIDKLELPAKKIGQVWSTPLSVYEGPFHTNGQLHISLPPRYFDEAHTPFFRGPVTTSAESVVYYNGYGPLDLRGNPDPRLLGMVFKYEPKTGAAKISLPSFPELAVKQAAYGASPPGKPTFGILLPHDSGNHLTGGIAVDGPLSELIFQAEFNQNFKIIFKQLIKETIVEIDGKHNLTLVYSSQETPVQFEGIPNGAIFVNGDIGAASGTGIHGTVKGRWTVGTPADLFIMDSLFYSDTSRGGKPAGTDCLGLIGRSAFITRNAPDLLFLYGTIFTVRQEKKEKVGTFFVLPNRDMPHQGSLFWWGSYIGEYPAVMGTFDSTTGESKDGYTLHKFYDVRQAANPPPFFPVIEDAAGTTSKK